MANKRPDQLPSLNATPVGSELVLIYQGNTLKRQAYQTHAVNLMQQLTTDDLPTTGSRKLLTTGEYNDVLSAGTESLRLGQTQAQTITGNITLGTTQPYKQLIAPNAAGYTLGVTAPFAFKNTGLFPVTLLGPDNGSGIQTLILQPRAEAVSYFDTTGLVIKQASQAPVVNVLDFGAKGDGATNDKAAIQAAIDYVSGVGGGTVYFPYTSGGYRLQASLLVKSNVRLVGESINTRIFNTNAAGDFNVLTPGTISVKAATESKTYLLTGSPNIQDGSNILTLNTVAESSNFLPGDFVVMISPEFHFVKNGLRIPKLLRLNKVVKVNSASGEITLDRAIAGTWTTAYVGLIKQRAAGAQATGPLGLPIFVAENIVVENLTFEQTKNQFWLQYGGMYNFIFRNIIVKKGRGGIYTNMNSGGIWENMVVEFSQRAIELACGSDGVTMRNITANYVSPFKYRVLSIVPNVSGVTTVNTAEPHEFVTGDRIQFTNIPEYSGVIYTITVVDTDTFTLNGTNNGSSATVSANSYVSYRPIVELAAVKVGESSDDVLIDNLRVRGGFPGYTNVLLTGCTNVRIINSTFNTKKVNGSAIQIKTGLGNDTYAVATVTVSGSNTIFETVLPHSFEEDDTVTFSNLTGWTAPSYPIRLISATSFAIDGIAVAATPTGSSTVSLTPTSSYNPDWAGSATSSDASGCDVSNNLFDMGASLTGYFLRMDNLTSGEGPINNIIRNNNFLGTFTGSTQVALKPAGKNNQIRDNNFNDGALLIDTDLILDNRIEGNFIPDGPTASTPAYRLDNNQYRRNTSESSKILRKGLKTWAGEEIITNTSNASDPAVNNPANTTTSYNRVFPLLANSLQVADLITVEFVLTKTGTAGTCGLVLNLGTVINTLGSTYLPVTIPAAATSVRGKYEFYVNTAGIRKMSLSYADSTGVAQAATTSLGGQNLTSDRWLRLVATKPSNADTLTFDNVVWTVKRRGITFET